MNRSFSQGKSGENRVKNLLESCGYAVTEVLKAERSHYDLICKGDVEFSVEIKNDLRAVKTGNVAIEIYNPISGKNSGLSITQADLWVHIIGEAIFVTSVKLLTAFIGLQEPTRVISNAGDGNATIYLYKSDYIIPTIFRRIDDIDCKEVINTLKGLI